jgi:hypothetical protein
MPLMRRVGRPGLLGTAARTAVIAGTAGAVADRRERRSRERYATEEAAQPAPAPAPAPVPAAAPASPAPPADDLAGQLQRLGDLHASGTLNDEEFAAAKARLLS